MQEKEFEKMVDNILIYYPLFYRKIKTSMNHEKHSRYSKPTGYYQVLGILIHLGPLSISEIGKMLYISKPNMTSLIDRLVTDGNAKRTRSKDDRRIVKVEITVSPAPETSATICALVAILLIGLFFSKTAIPSSLRVSTT